MSKSQWLIDLSIRRQGTRTVLYFPLSHPLIGRKQLSTHHGVACTAWDDVKKNTKSLVVNKFHDVVLLCRIRGIVMQAFQCFFLGRCGCWNAERDENCESWGFLFEGKLINWVVSDEVLFLIVQIRVVIYVSDFSRRLHFLNDELNENEHHNCDILLSYKTILNVPYLWWNNIRLGKFLW